MYHCVKYFTRQDVRIPDVNFVLRQKILCRDILIKRRQNNQAFLAFTMCFVNIRNSKNPNMAA